MVSVETGICSGEKGLLWQSFFLDYVMVFREGKQRIYKFVSTCSYMNDRKHMRKVREKRICSIQKQIDKHEDKIKNESGRLDTTKDYWRKEIDEKFLKQIEEDENYLDEDDSTN